MNSGGIYSFAAGPHYNTAYGVGAKQPADGVAPTVFLFSASSKIWEIPEQFFGFPNRWIYATAEDASGARYVAAMAIGVAHKGVSTTLVKVNASGSVVWARPIAVESDISHSTQVSALAIASDGNLLLAGSVGREFSKNRRGLVGKVNPANGAMLWSRELNFNGAGLEFSYVAPGSDGSIYVAGISHFSGSDYDVYAARLTSTGTPIWTRNIDIGGGTTDRLSDAQLTPNGIALSIFSGISPRVRVLSASAGAVLWDRLLPDPEGAEATKVEMVRGPANTLTVAVAYSDGADRKVLGVYRLNPVAKTTLLNTRYSAPNPNYRVASLSDGSPIVLDSANKRITRLHPTNGTVTWHRNIIATVTGAADLQVDRLNNIYAFMDEQQTPGVPIALLSTFNPAGTARENRRSAGYSSSAAIGLNDSVWLFGTANTLNRSQEASFIRYTQTLP